MGKKLLGKAVGLGWQPLQKSSGPPAQIRRSWEKWQATLVDPLIVQEKKQMHSRLYVWLPAKHSVLNLSSDFDLSILNQYRNTGLM